MPGSSYKVNSSPRPNKKSDANSAASGTAAPTSNQLNGSADGVAEGKENGKIKNGIMKKSSGDVPTIPEEQTSPEKWEKNYVPCVENGDVPPESKLQNGNGVTPGKHKKKLKVAKDDTGAKDDKGDSDDNMVRQVSEIFDEVFKVARGNWCFKIEYFVACLGMPIAFSSLWRFPYLLSKYGGGAFLFCYLLLMVLIGVPFYVMEAGLGQFAQLSCVHVWRCVPVMQGVGIAMIVLSLITAIYNSQLVAYVVHYFFASFVSNDGTMLWGDCRSSWTNCYGSEAKKICLFLNETATDSAHCSRLVVSSSRYYWEDKVLRLQNLEDIGKTGPIHWDLSLCLVFVWVAVFVILVKGIKSGGKAALITGILPICILLAFLIGSLQMEGAVNGLSTFYEPDWDRLAEAIVWQRAAEQVIFSLCVVYGSVITFSSYKKAKSMVQFAPVILTVANTVVTVIAATTVFAMLGILAAALGNDNPKSLISPEVSGIELMFTRLPEAIAVALPVPQAWSVFFFLMLMCFGIHAQFALVETALTAVYDAIPKLRNKKVIVVGCLVAPLFLLSLPLSSSTGLHMHRVLESAIIGPNVLLLSIIEILSIQYLYGVRRFCNDLKLIMKTEVSIYWKVCWVFVCPATLITIFVFAAINWRQMVFGDHRNDADWALYLSWTLTLLPLAVIPVTFIFTLLYRLCVKEPVFQPSQIWGPGCPLLREHKATDAEKSDTHSAGKDNEAYSQN